MSHAAAQAAAANATSQGAGLAPGLCGFRRSDHIKSSSAYAHVNAHLRVLRIGPYTRLPKDTMIPPEYKGKVLPLWRLFSNQTSIWEARNLRGVGPSWIDKLMPDQSLREQDIAGAGAKLEEAMG